ncbi:GerW family sporulation protein [Clostridia bacterium OttesenSCG-928-F22]|nr:GerW family sporulation protein [Clostridia bacterium OttesenSCG-928-F22]
MDHHPIENIMQTTMEQLKGIIDVNTIVGSPVNTLDGATIIPVSKVSFGFASGGGEYGKSETSYSEGGTSSTKLPFAGGSGAGVSLNPVAFLVVHTDGVKLLPVNYHNVWDRVVENIPDVIRQLKEAFGNKNITITQNVADDRED